MPRSRRITEALLRAWPLTQPPADGDKEDRGRLLIVAGSDEIPGAAILAANAALRTGAGKVRVATTPFGAASIGQAVPEARVVKFEPGPHADDVDAIVVGPGMTFSKALSRYVAKQTAPLLLDAAALETLRSSRRASGAMVATPHAGEMASLLDCDKQEIERNPGEIAAAFARAHDVVVALKGATTVVADPDGGIWINEQGNIGLAVSGSGDVLAGVIGALLARGCDGAQAAVWGVALHARAGERMVARYGPLGGLARELPDYIPREINALARGRRAGASRRAQFR
jgi:ADP-dependent NAD(P)H-hydrate dehydratase